MDERVLITGGAGFLGLHLAAMLLKHGAQVTLLDNFFRGQSDQQLQDLLGSATLVTHDLTQPLHGRLGPGFTQVYHLAAIVGVRYSNESPMEVLRTNLLATLNILDWCAAQTNITLCFASSSEVYAGAVSLGQTGVPTPEVVPLTISEPTVPRSSYAASKIAGEICCLNFARRYGFPVRIIRYHNLYGPRMGYEHVIPQFIQRILKHQNPFPIYGAQQTRAFCYIDDAVDATIKLMQLPASGILTVNVGNDQEETRIRDLAHRLFILAGYHPQIELHPPPQGSPERRCPDLTLLRSLIAYEPAINLQVGLERTYAWYQTV